jgi:hypothetical protein
MTTKKPTTYTIHEPQCLSPECPKTHNDCQITDQGVVEKMSALLKFTQEQIQVSAASAFVMGLMGGKLPSREQVYAQEHSEWLAAMLVLVRMGTRNTTGPGSLFAVGNAIADQEMARIYTDEGPEGTDVMKDFNWQQERQP